eukprot:TRINITY_DN14993_c0_g2_i4.p1 TRINITY_DN14993_c0_g2~~TRINITY_DN14993_c0_g2_i4.p1  ORF type:complete len:1773 (-),score=297.75 TRINITY_DN14993_c0_g2_i4:106-5379(-)
MLRSLVGSEMCIRDSNTSGDNATSSYAVEKPIGGTSSYGPSLPHSSIHEAIQLCYSRGLHPSHHNSSSSTNQNSSSSSPAQLPKRNNNNNLQKGSSSKPYSAHVMHLHVPLVAGVPSSSSPSSLFFHNSNNSATTTTSGNMETLSGIVSSAEESRLLDVMSRVKTTNAHGMSGLIRKLALECNSKLAARQVLINKGVHAEDLLSSSKMSMRPGGGLAGGLAAQMVSAPPPVEPMVQIPASQGLFSPEEYSSHFAQSLRNIGLSESALSPSSDASTSDSHIQSRLQFLPPAVQADEARRRRRARPLAFIDLHPTPMTVLSQDSFSTTRMLRRETVTLLLSAGLSTTSIPGLGVGSEHGCSIASCFSSPPPPAQASNPRARGMSLMGSGGGALTFSTSSSNSNMVAPPSAEMSLVYLTGLVKSGAIPRTGPLPLTPFQALHLNIHLSTFLPPPPATTTSTHGSSSQQTTGSAFFDSGASSSSSAALGSNRMQHVFYNTLGDVVHRLQHHMNVLTVSGSHFYLTGFVHNVGPSSLGGLLPLGSGSSGGIPTLVSGSASTIACNISRFAPLFFVAQKRMLLWSSPTTGELSGKFAGEPLQGMGVTSSKSAKQQQADSTASSLGAAPLTAVTSPSSSICSGVGTWVALSRQCVAQISTYSSMELAAAASETGGGGASESPSKEKAVSSSSSSSANRKNMALLQDCGAYYSSMPCVSVALVGTSNSGGILTKAPVGAALCGWESLNPPKGVINWSAALLCLTNDQAKLLSGSHQQSLIFVEKLHQNARNQRMMFGMSSANRSTPMSLTTAASTTLNPQLSEQSSRVAEAQRKRFALTLFSCLTGVINVSPTFSLATDSDSNPASSVPVALFQSLALTTLTGMQRLHCPPLTCVPSLSPGNVMPSPNNDIHGSFHGSSQMAVSMSIPQRATNYMFNNDLTTNNNSGPPAMHEAPSTYHSSHLHVSTPFIPTGVFSSSSKPSPAGDSWLQHLLSTLMPPTAASVGAGRIHTASTPFSDTCTHAIATSTSSTSNTSTAVVGSSSIGNRNLHFLTSSLSATATSNQQHQSHNNDESSAGDLSNTFTIFTQSCCAQEGAPILPSLTSTVNPLAALSGTTSSDVASSTTPWNPALNTSSALRGNQLLPLLLLATPGGYSYGGACGAVTTSLQALFTSASDPLLSSSLTMASISLLLMRRLPQAPNAPNSTSMQSMAALYRRSSFPATLHPGGGGGGSNASAPPLPPQEAVKVLHAELVALRISEDNLIQQLLNYERHFAVQRKYRLSDALSVAPSTDLSNHFAQEAAEAPQLPTPATGSSSTATPIIPPSAIATRMLEHALSSRESVDILSSQGTVAGYIALASGALHTPSEEAAWRAANPQGGGKAHPLTKKGSSVKRTTSQRKKPAAGKKKMSQSVKRTGSSSLSAPKPKINLSASVPNTPRLSIVDDADFDDSASDNGSTSNSIAGHSTSQHVDDVRGPLVYLSAVKQSASTHTQQHNHTPTTIHNSAASFSMASLSALLAPSASPASHSGIPSSTSRPFLAAFASIINGSMVAHTTEHQHGGGSGKGGAGSGSGSSSLSALGDTDTYAVECRLRGRYFLHNCHGGSVLRFFLDRLGLFLAPVPTSESNAASVANNNPLSIGIALANAAQQLNTDAPQFSSGARKSVFGSMSAHTTQQQQQSGGSGSAGGNRSYDVSPSSLIVSLSFSTISLPTAEVAFRAILSLEARPAHPLSNTVTYTAFPSGPNGTVVAVSYTHLTLPTKRIV